MADYKKLYLYLFNGVTDIINEMETAARGCRKSLKQTKNNSGEHSSPLRSPHNKAVCCRGGL